MYGTFRTTLLALSILAFSASGAQADETASKAGNKKIATISVSTQKEKEKAVKSAPQKAAASSQKDKRRISTRLPKNLIQNDQATLSDDEVTRIKLIKRYEGVKNPRTDWNHGLRTLNWHYTESNSDND